MPPKVVEPTRATKYSIWVDLYSPSNYLICPSRQIQIPTQIKLGIPPGYYGRIASKFGLAIEHQIHVGAGVIDPHYTGEVKVLLINSGKHYYKVKQGDPIAQLILEKASIPTLRQAKELPTTGREKGSGSNSQSIFHKS